MNEQKIIKRNVTWIFEPDIHQIQLPIQISFYVYEPNLKYLRVE